MTERITITPRSTRVTFSRGQSLDEDTAARLVAAGACRGGIADPVLVSLAGDVLAAESRSLKFAHPDRPRLACLTEAIRKFPACAHIWQMGRVDGANTHTFEITD